MMCTWAIGAVEVLEPSDGVLARVGWKLANMGNFRSMEHVNQPVDQLAMLRAREQRVVALIARTVQGDQTALAELYDETNTLVYSLALHILGEQFAAEDVTIEVYTQVHQQASHYDPSRRAPSAWLLTLTRSRAIYRLRSETLRRAGEESLDEAGPPIGTLTPRRSISWTQTLRLRADIAGG